MHMFKKIAFTLPFFLVQFTIYAQQADAILGEWYTTERDAKIEIYKEGSTYSGKVVWLEQPTENGKPILDANNADKSKRNQPILGIKLIEGFKYKNGVWEEGKIYDPRNGKYYSSTIKKKNSDVLEVRGFVGFSMIGRTVEWYKAK